MTIKEFAALAGVSISTVSKIMNGKDETISSRTREHVLSLAKEYNYTPYASSVTPFTKTLTVGIIFRDLKKTGHMMPGILSAAMDHGYSVLLRESADSPEAELKNITAMEAAHVDGILWDPVSEENAEYVRRLNRAGIPFLYIDAAADGARPDFRKMGYAAAKALIDRNHTKIACIAGYSPSDKSFYQGYRDCLFESGLSLNDALVFPDADELPASSIANHLISGVVIADYSQALRLFRTMDALCYSIPEDLSVITLKEDAEAASIYPQISAITIPYAEYGQYLTEALIARLEKRTSPQPAPLRPRLNGSYSISIPADFHRERILSIGSINIDTYLNFDELPRTGRTVTSSDSTSYPGGKSLNQAVGAAKLGHNVSIIGHVGDDEDSDMIFRMLRDLHIDSYGLKRSRGSSTGKAYIFVQRNGDSMISILSGANSTVQACDIEKNERLFAEASYCLIQTEIPMEAVLRAAELAKKHKLPTVLKPSSCTHLPDELLSSIDIIIPNTEELFLICPEGTSIREKAEILLQKGVQTVIVTQGGDGCSIFEPDSFCHIPAADFLPVDNSGAADAFISALVSYLLYGYDIISAAKIAVYAAGFSITRQGVSTALVDKSTLEAYLQMKEPLLLNK